MAPDPRAGHLTASDFYKYAKCPSWLYWDIFGDPKDKAEVSPMMRHLREEGLVHEKEVVAGLGPFVEMPTDGRPEDLFAATVKAMEEGAPLIYQGTLMDGDWVGRPDLLARIEGSSRFGDWMYEAVDVKAAHHLNDVHKHQLVFYALLLERVQGAMPATGKILNARKETLDFPIREAYAGFFEALSKILEIRAGKKPDLYLASSCKDSPWYPRLLKEVVEADDVSRLYKIYRKEYRALKEAGFATVRSVAETSADELSARVAGVSRGRLERLQLQAVALAEDRILRLAEPDLPGFPEIHFDIEGDPFSGAEYLFGVLLRDGKKDEYLSFLAEHPDDEEKAWTAFCDFIEGHAGTPIYHYGWYELDVIRRLSGRYGVSREAAEALDHANMIDLNRVVQQAAVFPLHFYSLKDVGKRLGFRWRADDASGANSVLWFQDWLETGDRGILRKIIEYNEDDVRATAHLKDWLVSGG